jgi:hypothetical protein
MTNYAAFFKYCDLLELTDDVRLKMIQDHTAGRTSSLKELDLPEYNLLVRKVQKMEQDDNQKMRNRITYCFAELGFKDSINNVDYSRIDAYLKQHCGDNNPRKKGLYQLRHSELQKVKVQIEAYYKSSVRRQTTKVTDNEIQTTTAT